jgi:hypothetical protein
VVFGGGAAGVPKMRDGTAWAVGNVLTNAVKPMDGTNGFRLDAGAAGDTLAQSITTGDVNGDGYADIIVGASGAAYNGANSGAAYVIFGGAAAGVPKMRDGTAWAANQLLSAAKPIDGNNGFRLVGATAGDALGYAVGAGDINHDGKADFIVGAKNAGYSFAGSGSAYLMFGGAAAGVPKMFDGTAWATTQLMSAAKPIDGTNGVRFDGAAASDKLGYFVTTGDINNDTYADFAITAAGVSSNSAAIYVINGKAGAWTNPQTVQ